MFIGAAHTLLLRIRPNRMSAARRGIKKSGVSTRHPDYVMLDASSLLRACTCQSCRVRILMLSKPSFFSPISWCGCMTEVNKKLSGEGVWNYYIHTYIHILTASQTHNQNHNQIL